MPGTETGRDFDNAFSWDFTAYPGGTRVTGETARYDGTDINHHFHVDCVARHSGARLHPDPLRWNRLHAEQ